MEKVAASEAIEMETNSSATAPDRVYAQAPATETDGMLDEDPFAEPVTEDVENNEEMGVEGIGSAAKRKYENPQTGRPDIVLHGPYS